MAPFFSQTLIRAATASSCLRVIRRLSTVPKISSHAELIASEADLKAVEKFEDAIHAIIAKRSRPDWLIFVPGASYWVPPRRASYGVAEFVDRLANLPTDEEYLSLTTLQGWPSSAFYIHGGASSHFDLSGFDALTTKTSLREEEG